jgi:hypothetical protein
MKQNSADRPPFSAVNKGLTNWLHWCGPERAFGPIVGRPTAAYMFWLLGNASGVSSVGWANTCFEPRARLAMMLFDFYVPLRRRRLITGVNIQSINDPVSNWRLCRLGRCAR